MRERRYKVADNAFGWYGYLQRDVLPTLRDSIREVDTKRCTATPPSIHKVLMINDFIMYVESVMVQLKREWE